MTPLLPTSNASFAAPSATGKPSSQRNRQIDHSAAPWHSSLLAQRSPAPQLSRSRRESVRARRFRRRRRCSEPPTQPSGDSPHQRSLPASTGMSDRSRRAPRATAPSEPCPDPVQAEHGNLAVRRRLRSGTDRERSPAALLRDADRPRSLSRAGSKCTQTGRCRSAAPPQQRVPISPGDSHLQPGAGAALDPKAMLEAVRHAAEHSLARLRLQAPGSPLAEESLTQTELESISGILADLPLGPQQRAATYRAMEKLPGVPTSRTPKTRSDVPVPRSRATGCTTASSTAAESSQSLRAFGKS